MKNEAIAEFKETIEKTQSFNTKIDAIFEILHIGILNKDLDLLKEYLVKIKDLLKDGGDWEKRNRLKVYDGLNYILNRNFKEAGKLFLEALMTFTSYELFDYKTFVFYTAVTNIITVDRNTLKNRVIDNSDVVSCINEIPHLENFLNTFYEGNYNEFLKEFYAIVQRLKTDFFFSKHYNYFILLNKNILFMNFEKQITNLNQSIIKREIFLILLNLIIFKDKKYQKLK
jgi:26S proteasome regulatory subunit N7